MKLFVTGGAGFIGSNFIHYWLKKHPTDSIINFDALTYAGNLHNLTAIEQLPNYSFIHGNICDTSTVLEVTKNVDIIVHFAAESHVDRSITDPTPFVKTNVEGTLVLLDAAKKNHVPRFHHISTDEVFGDLELNSSQKFTLATPYQPRSPYSASKAGADHLVRAFFKTYQLPITISNCSNNYGPYQFPEKLFSLVITNLLEGKKVPVYGDGLHVRDWLYVEDHCRAIDQIIQKGTIGSTYLVGGSHQDISNIDIIKKIIRLMGKDESEIAYVKDRSGHDRRYAIDWSQTKSELGWEPQESLESGLQKTIDWYTANTAWWKNVKSGAYQQYYKNQYGKE